MVKQGSRKIAMNEEYDPTLALAIAHTLYENRWTDDQYMDIIRGNDWIEPGTIQFILMHVTAARKMINTAARKNSKKLKEEDEEEIKKQPEEEKTSG